MDQTVATTIPGLPAAQIAALAAGYDRAIARRRLRFAAGVAVFALLLLLAAVGSEVSLATFFAKLGNFTSYFYRILHLDSGAWVWTDFGEWFWGLKKWGVLIAETVLISYVGTIGGAVAAFLLNFLAARNVGPRPWLCIAVARGLEFCRTVPGIVFALIFVIAFGLGPMAGVLAIMIHTPGALGKLYSEVVENIDMKQVEGVRATGASWVAGIRFAVVPQVMAGFASYTLLRFEINVREASVMGFVGAGGIGQELLVAIRKFYYSDVSAMLILIILLVFAIDIGTGFLRHRLIGTEQTR
jgi:phosphonate transport system permease protein